MPTNMFYDDYESDPMVAQLVDDVCLSCPVMKQCLQRGTEKNEWGVWGGVYLESGNKSKNRNAHKTDDIWEEIRKRISE